MNEKTFIKGAVNSFGSYVSCCSLSMSKLYSNFQSYLQLNTHRIKWVLVFGIVFMVLYLILQKKGCVKRKANPITAQIYGILLSLSCSFIFVMTLFSRSFGVDFYFRFQPFASYYIAFAEGGIEVMLQIIINIVMFIPIGFLLPCCFKLYEKYRYVLITAVIASLSIELLQLIFRIGLFETDDVINNVFGAMIGLGIYVVAKKVKNHEKETY